MRNDETVNSLLYSIYSTFFKFKNKVFCISIHIH